MTDLTHIRRFLLRHPRAVCQLVPCEAEGGGWFAMVRLSRTRDPEVVFCNPTAEGALASLDAELRDAC